MRDFKDLPHIKLSYETYVDKKVLDADYISAIPFGKKALAWFVEEEDECVCYVIEMKKEANKKFVYFFQRRAVSFDKSLCCGKYGTILYGCVVKQPYANANIGVNIGESTSNKKPHFFVVEDIFYYKGKQVHLKNEEKLNLMGEIFSKEIRQVAPTSSFILFGLPVMISMNESLDSLQQQCDNLNIHHYQYKYFHKHDIYNISPNFLFRTTNEKEEEKEKETSEYKVMMPRQFSIKDKDKDKDNSGQKNNNNKNNKNTSESTKQKQKEIQKIFQVMEKTFKVTPDIQNDIYYLHDIETNTIVEKAYIPDYTTSVMMNRLFRNIKENENLDALEESDDEEEFEDQNIDKFVDLNKSYHMVCKYHFKFKKWVPLRVLGF